MREWIFGATLALAVALGVVMPARAGLPETPRPRQFTVADGLPSNRINGIAEDREGYLWVATSDGLARFDGLGFRLWRSEQGLRDNFVWAVHVDAQDRVWIGTRTAGLAVLDARRDTLRWMDDPRAGLAGREVWSITSTPAGDLWVGTADAGLYRFAGALLHDTVRAVRSARADRFMPVPGELRSLPDAGVRKLLTAADGSVWVGTGSGAARWTGQDFERIPAAALPSAAVNGMTLDRDATLWVGTPGGVAVRRPDGTAQRATWRPATQTVLQMLLRDRAGTRWFDLPEGLGVGGDAGIVTVPLYSAAARGLVRPSWVEAREDRDGGLWFASNTSGLWFLPSRWRQFSVLTRRLDDPATLANAQVRGIAPSADGSLWLVGSGGVLDRFDSETGVVQHAVRDVGAGVVLIAVLEDRAGAVWVTYPDGLARVTPGSAAVQRWSADATSDRALAGDTASLVQAADGALWMAGEGGVQVREPDGRVRMTLAAGDGRGLPAGTVVHALQLAPSGVVWVATSRGVYAWDASTQHLRWLRGAADAPVYAIAFDGHGGPWLARQSAVEKYVLHGDAPSLQERFDSAAGFPQLAPSGLAIDAQGIAWVTSVRGLIRLDPARRQTRIYGVHDGLPSQEFADPPVARPGDGRILAGTPEGLVVFDPSVVHPRMRAPRLVVESVDVRRGSARVQLDPARPFQIGHDDRDLHVRARLIAFNDASTHDYRFRLRGFDRGWVDVGATGERTFSQLPAGRYRLDVIARTADPVWSAPLAIEFRVRPPWWRSAWATVLAVVLLIGAFAGAAAAYRRRLRRRHALLQSERERQLAQDASEAKTRFLATFGHEVRTPMTGVLGMTELLLDTPLDTRQRGYVASVRSAGEHLLRLLNDALDLARIESGRLELDEHPFDLHALLGDIAALVAPLAQRRGLAFNLHIGDDVPRGVLGDCSRLRQILLNLLGNAQKFTEQGAVALRVSGHDGAIRFEVADTGPGLSTEQQARLFQRFEQAEGARTAARYGGSGLGLAISLELAEAMGGRIGVDSQPGHGARFHVDLPLRAAAVPQASSEPGMAQVAPLFLLLVEDDATVAEVVSGLLRAQGHRVRHAPHGLAALAEVQVERFDAALLDLDLPGIDGFALARQLRAMEFAAPLIAVTARADAESEPQARAAGFDAFLRKPVTGRMLAQVLASVLNQRVEP